MRDEDAALRAGDQLLGALAAADELEAAAAATAAESAATPSSASAATTAAAGRLNAPLLRPVPVIREALQDSVFDVHHSLQRKAAGVEGLGEEVGVRGIGVDRHTFVRDLLAKPRAAARLAEGAAALVVGPRIEAANELRHDVGNGLRFEHHRVQAGLDCLGVAAAHSLLRRRATERRRVDQAPVACTGTRPAGARRVGRADGRGELRVAVAVIGEQSATGRNRVRARIGAQEAGDEHVVRARGRLLRDVDRALGGRGARLRREVRRVVEVAVNGCIRLRTEFRHPLRILRTQLRETLGQVHRAPEALIVEDVRGGRRAPLAD